MDFSTIFNGEALTLEQFAERTKEMKLADLSGGEYVAKGKYDSDIKKAREELKTAKDTIATLEANKGDTEALQAELDKYKQADAERQKAEQEQAAHAALVERFNKVKGERQFSSEYAESGVLDAFGKAINDPTNTGKGDNEIFESLTNNTDGLFRNPQQEPLKIPPVTGNWVAGSEAEAKMRHVMGLPPVKGADK